MVSSIKLIQPESDAVTVVNHVVVALWAVLGHSEMNHTLDVFWDFPFRVFQLRTLQLDNEISEKR